MLLAELLDINDPESMEWEIATPKHVQIFNKFGLEGNRYEICDLSLDDGDVIHYVRINGGEVYEIDLDNMKVIKDINLSREPTSSNKDVWGAGI